MKKVYSFRYICPICHEDAFFLDYMPTKGNIVEVRGVMTENGEPEPGTPIRCQNCNGPIRHPAVDHVRKLAIPFVVD